MRPAGRGETRCGAGDDAVQTCICRASGIVGAFADYFTGSVLHVFGGVYGVWLLCYVCVSHRLDLWTRGADPCAMSEEVITSTGRITCAAMARGHSRVLSGFHVLRRFALHTWQEEELSARTRRCVQQHCIT